jgi:hypothetical protein
MKTRLTFIKKELNVLKKTCKQMKLKYKILHNTGSVYDVEIDHEYEHDLYYLGSNIEINKQLARDEN